MAFLRSPDQAGLEVVHDNAAHAPEVLIHQEKEPIAHGKAVMESSQPSQRVCGMSSRTFWTLAVVACIIIVAAAVGGGVAGSRHRGGSSAPRVETSSSTSSAVLASSSTSSSTSSAPTPFQTSGLLGLDCPKLNDTTQSVVGNLSTTPYIFTVYCDEDFPGNDLTSAEALTLNDCLIQCASWTESGSPACEGIVFNANLTGAIPHSGGNCYLKSSVTNGILSNSGATWAGGVWQH